MWVEVSASSIPSTTLVGCIYRPPNSSVGSINAVCDLLDQALSMRGLVVGCGDLNVNLMDPEGPHSALLSDYITSRAFFQPINMPTRITPSSATLLDIFLITSKVTVKSAHVRNVGISDHSAICLCLCWRKPKLPSSSVLRQSYKRFDPKNSMMIYCKYHGLLVICLTTLMTDLTSSTGCSSKCLTVMLHYAG